MVRTLKLKLEVGSDQIEDAAKCATAATCNVNPDCNGSHQLPERNVDPDPLFHGNPLPYAISVGTVLTGDWASSVPDKLVADGRLGVQLDEDQDAARRALEHAVAEAARRDAWLADHPPRVTWPGGQFGAGRLPTDDPLIAQLVSIVAEMPPA